MGTSLIAPDAVRAHLRRLLLSERIAAADSIVRLLKYTVEKTLGGEPGALKEAVHGLTEAQSLAGTDLDVENMTSAVDPAILTAS
jgi:hypothetical protein